MPYASLDVEGYQLEIVAFDGWENHSHLIAPVPIDEHRYGIKEGALVKLIFHYKNPYVVKDSIYTAEHMWVQYLGQSQGNMIGRLDNNPDYTDLVECDDIIRFHPSHIVRIWGYDPEPYNGGPTKDLPLKH